MKPRRKPWREGFGAPQFFILYRTPDVWRYAIYFSGAVVDGCLAPHSTGSEPGEARNAAHAKAEDVAGRPLTISREADDRPGWWTGTITTGPTELTLDSATD